MKLLLIGFSEQNANLLSFLIQQNFKEIDCVAIERHLTADLRFELPVLGTSHQDAHGYIINLDGVGMSSYQYNHKDNLATFTQGRPTLLTTRTPIDVWQSGLAGERHYLYIQSSYTKDTILPVLQKLIDQSFLFSPNTISQNISQPAPESKPTLAPEKKADDTPNKQSLFDNTLMTAANNPAQAVIEKLLRESFSQVYELPMVKAFSKLFFADEPFILKTSRYEVVIDPQRNLAISPNIARVIDYLTVTKTHDEFAHSITVEPLDKTALNEHLAKLESQNAKKYVLNTLLWQIYHAILPDEIATMAHNLQIKVKFMPNLADVEGVPTYTQAVMASCLSVPKTLDNLYTLFSEATDSALNRLCLLAILSKIADLQLLTAKPATAPARHDDPSHHTKNDGVNKAAKTGFFQRLLSKLSF